MAAGRVICALRLLACFLLMAYLTTTDISPSGFSLLCRPKLVVRCRRSASLKIPVMKQTKRGTKVVALPFDTTVPLPAYFALCCDVSSNPGPERFGLQNFYTRKQLIDIRESMCSAECNYHRDSAMNRLKLHNIYLHPGLSNCCRYHQLSRNCAPIQVRISTGKLVSEYTTRARGSCPVLQHNACGRT